jgi:hypothetical protein
VLYQSDDDFWLPEHAETMLTLLERHALVFGTTFFVDDPAQAVAVLLAPLDPAVADAREVIVLDRAAIRLCATAHTMRLYRSLATGWNRVDRRFRVYPEFSAELFDAAAGSVAVSYRPTAVHFSSKTRTEMQPNERRDELASWRARLADPVFRASFVEGHLTAVLSRNATLEATRRKLKRVAAARATQ